MDPYAKRLVSNYSPVETSSSSAAMMNTNNGMIIAEETHTTTTHSSAGRGLGIGWFGELLLWAFIFFVFWWLVYYSTKPWFVTGADGSLDTNRVALWAAVTALISIIVAALIVWIVRRSRKC